MTPFEIEDAMCALWQAQEFEEQINAIEDQSSTDAILKQMALMQNVQLLLLHDIATQLKAANHLEAGDG